MYSCPLSRLCCWLLLLSLVLAWLALRLFFVIDRLSFRRHSTTKVDNSVTF